MQHSTRTDFQDWSQTQFEALMLEVAEQLKEKPEATIVFSHEKPENYQISLLRQFENSGYRAQFQMPAGSSVPHLVVRRD